MTAHYAHTGCCSDRSVQKQLSNNAMRVIVNVGALVRELTCIIAEGGGNNQIMFDEPHT